jgi:hypothetical protein
LRKEFTRRIVSIERVVSDKPKPYWAGTAHNPKRVRVLLTLECGHTVERRSCSVTTSTKSAVCEWCQEMKEQIA